MTMAAGTSTPATTGWKWLSSSCSPTKYHGAFSGFGVTFGLAISRRGASNRKDTTKGTISTTSAATARRTSRWGQTMTSPCSSGTFRSPAVGWPGTIPSNLRPSARSGSSLIHESLLSIPQRIPAPSPMWKTHHTHHEGGEDGDMEHVEAKQRRRPNLRSAQQHLLRLLPDEGHESGDRGAHCHPPVRQLVPGQQIAGERQEQGQEEQDHSDDPVEFPGRLVRPPVEDPGHVSRHGHHHEVGRPAVHVPDELAEAHLALQELDGAVGRAGAGHG